jgi:serine/threonine protein kinase
MNSSKFSRTSPDPSVAGSFHDIGSMAHGAHSVYAPNSNTFSPEDYAAGQVLSGRFRVEHVIGIGSMGVVLAARHLELDERVAIKFIRPEMQQLPGVMARFAREAKAAVSIKSEHVAQVFDVGTAEGIGPYIVMEYLEGRDLGAVLELEGRLPIRRAVHYLMQACEALAVAHSAGITHRDIKPENLFLTRQGDLELVKLLDFGISKAALTGKVFGDELTDPESECLLGTPLYMSPEQIRATAEIDHRTDIWSLGVVLYELITARSAFVADSVSQVWTRILETAPTPLVAHCPEAPLSLQAVIDRCLDKDPALRFQNVAELAIALLPFAPSRARLYAQRASSILGTKSDSVFPAPLPSADTLLRSSHPLFDSFGGQQTALMAVPFPDLSAPPVFAQRSHRAVAEQSKTGVFGAVAVAGLAGALFMFWVGARRAPANALGSDTAAPASEVSRPPVVASTPVAAASAVEPEQLPLSRAILVDSLPSGALVKVGGQALGITPLSALLPVGMQELAISKQGYQTEQLLVQVDAAAAGARALRTRVALRATPREPRAELPTSRPAPRIAPRARPIPRRTAPVIVREEPVAAPVETFPEPARLEEKPAAPSPEERNRPRLLDDQTRPRLLD